MFLGNLVRNFTRRRLQTRCWRAVRSRRMQWVATVPTSLRRSSQSDDGQVGVAFVSSNLEFESKPAFAFDFGSRQRAAGASWPVLARFDSGPLVGRRATMVNLVGSFSAQRHVRSIGFMPRYGMVEVGLEVTPTNRDSNVSQPFVFDGPNRAIQC